jgi:hypothetical protein
MSEIKQEVPVTVPNIYLSDLEKLAQKVRQVSDEENVEISFEFILASLFPTCWKNIQADLNSQYTKGYIQGYSDKEEECRKYRRSYSEDEDPDCYYE